MEFRMGQRVFVRPSNSSERVQRGANLHGQFLPVNGQECVLDSYLVARINDGSISVHPLPAPLNIEEHPHLVE